MRLTLRTLLAYLDDALEPTETREIGAKLEESEVATALVARIREVVRRRRLLAPELVGRDGIDPNLVAAYLDNRLTPDLVAEIEKVAMENDMVLAEIASAHQILTSYASDPSEVPSAIRERLLALGSLTTSDKATSGSSGSLPVVASSGTNRVSDGEIRVVRGNGSAQNIPTVVPPRRSLMKQILVVGGVAIMTAAWIYTLALDAPVVDELKVRTRAALANRQEPVAPSPDRPIDAAVATDLDVAGNDRTANDATRSGVVSTGKSASTAVAGVQSPADESLLAASTQLPVMADGGSGEPLASSESLDAPADPGAPAASVVIAELTATKPNVAPLPAVVAPPAGESSVLALPVTYASMEGVTIEFRESDQHWYVVPRKSVVVTGTLVATPEPFEGVFEIGNNHGRMTLMGQTVARVVSPPAGASAAIVLDRGRLILQRTGSTEAVTVAILVGGLSFTVELSDESATCGVEISRREPRGPNQMLGPDGFTGELLVQSGSVVFRQPDHPQMTLSARSRLSLTPEDRLQNRGPEPVLASANEGVARWIDPVKRKTVSPMRRYASAFEKEFSAKEPVELTIAALTKDRRPYIAFLATGTMALADVHSVLLTTLAQSDHEEARLAAAAALRQWLPRTAANPDLLDADIQSVYPEQKAAILKRLLWGFGESDLTSPASAQMLVDLLEHSDVEIRELAIEQIALLTGRTSEYRALDTPNRRTSAVARWRAHLDREGGAFNRPQPVTE